MIEFTDRYKALGVSYPNYDTMCKGQCEGIGRVPINEGEQEEPWKSLWLKAHNSIHSEPCDGWHFVVCPDCGGTGKITNKESA